VPPNSQTDLYFTLALQPAYSWGAVGLGKSSMAGSLMFVLYSNAAGTNVTLSPRIARGHSEPVPYPEARVEALPGTGLINDTLVFMGACRNCRSWPGGSVDVSSQQQWGVFALGPLGGGSSDDIGAPLRIHSDVGAFTVDLRGAAAPAGGETRPPVISREAAKAGGQGVVQRWTKGGIRDWKATFHGLIMIFCFVGMFPMGILIMRLGGWVRWHAAHQVVGLAGVITAFGLGISISLSYNRVSAERDAAEADLLIQRAVQEL
jgi:hypothetical protein